MFLPFGKNKCMGTKEMHPLYGEGISMMNGVFETYSSVLVSMLMITSYKTNEKKCRSKKE